MVFNLEIIIFKDVGFEIVILENSKLGWVFYDVEVEVWLFVQQDDLDNDGNLEMLFFLVDLEGKSKCDLIWKLVFDDFLVVQCL